MLEVLLSCMHQKDSSIISESKLENIATLVVNQCDTQNDHWEIYDDKHRMFFTSARGLSVSRNFALANAKGEYCLIADDDEQFFENTEEIIKQTYEKIPQADIIIFKIRNAYKKLGNKARELRKLELLRVFSPQITFKRSSIVNKGLIFDTKLGAGTGNGGGEEIKFLLDCKKKKLKIYFVPIEIAQIDPQSPSTWFNGFDEKYFYNLGMVSRYIYGWLKSKIYIMYFILTKKKLYKKQTKPMKAYKRAMRGIRENKLYDKVDK